MAEKLKIYPFKESKTYPRTYLFESHGKREIIKAVRFDLLPDDSLPEWWNANFRPVANLSFGDWSDELGDLDDQVRSNNGDLDLVLDTVFYIATQYLKSNPETTIFFQGSMDFKSTLKKVNQRNQLYQRKLNDRMETLNNIGIVRGILNGKIQVYEPSRQYQAFLVKSR